MLQRCRPCRIARYTSIIRENSLGSSYWVMLQGKVSPAAAESAVVRPSMAHSPTRRLHLRLATNVPSAASDRRATSAPDHLRASWQAGVTSRWAAPLMTLTPTLTLTWQASVTSSKVDRSSIVSPVVLSDGEGFGEDALLSTVSRRRAGRSRRGLHLELCRVVPDGTSNCAEWSLMTPDPS